MVSRSQFYLVLIKHRAFRSIMPVQAVSKSDTGGDAGTDLVHKLMKYFDLAGCKALSGQWCSQYDEHARQRLFYQPHRLREPVLLTAKK